LLLAITFTEKISFLFFFFFFLGFSLSSLTPKGFFGFFKKKLIIGAVKDTLLRLARSAGRGKKENVTPNLAEIFGSARESLYISYFNFISRIAEISCWFSSFKITLKR